jgi:2-polyprenyl-3-methyl-5-hydroxy-6-metoxy-1,4-benzoquinol methylase
MVCGFVESEANFVATLTFPDMQFLSTGDFLRRVTYRTCTDCGTICQWPCPSQKVLNDYYANVDTPQTMVEEFSKYKKELYSNRFEFLNSEIHISNQTRVLEVGSANGNFLQKFKEVGCEILGVEPSREACKTAQLSGIPTLNCDLDSVQLDESEGWDLIMSFDTLEHVENPISFFQRTKSILRSGGYLYVEVPDTHGVVGDVTASCGNEINPAHIRHFTTTGLLRLSERVGLSVVHLSHQKVAGFPNIRIVLRNITPKERGGEIFQRALEHQKKLYNAAAKKLKELADSNNEVCVWGVGSDLVQTMTSYHEMYARYPNIMLCDKSEKKVGLKLFGAAVSHFQGVNKSCVFVVSPMSAILKQSIAVTIKGLFPEAKVHYLF